MSHGIGFLFWALTLFITAAGIFLCGFFPVPYYYGVKQKGQNAQVCERPTSLDGYKITPPSRKYDQTILMIVDALRFDFPTLYTMPVAYNSSCNRFKLRTDCPTVTMPRLKSITTGTLYNFIDIVLNLGHSEPLEDSILHRMKKHGDNIVFVGDRTWTYLFPSEFHRAQPNMDSFFVEDFYKGDKNVTHVLMTELERSDWNLLILHYLGLDHIGHVEGSTSAKIPSKLLEMDAAVANIIKSKQLHNQLLILTGDHGMRNGGGHGGSTPEELYVPLFVFYENCIGSSKNVEYKQIDLAPTLAILLSTEIPAPSTGCLISELLEDLSFEDQLYAYYYNAEHLIQQATIKFGQQHIMETGFYKWYLEGKSTHKLFLKTMRNNSVRSMFSFEKAKLNYIRASQDISSNLSAALVNFDYGYIFIGLTLMSLTTVYTVIFVLFAIPISELNIYSSKTRILLLIGIGVTINVGLHYKGLIVPSCALSSCLITIPIVACFYLASAIFKLVVPLVLQLRKSMTVSLTVPLPLLACFIFHSCSLASSSYIEEEHQTWYYLGATLFIMLFIKIVYHNIHIEQQQQQERRIGKSLEILWRNLLRMRTAVLMLITVALLRKLNQTGDKWRHLEDLGDILNKSENEYCLTLFFIFGLLVLLLRIRKFNTLFEMIPSTLAVFCIYLYRAARGTVVLFTTHHISTTATLAIFWIDIGVLFIIRYLPAKSKFTYKCDYQSKLTDLLQKNLTCSLLIAALLHKPHNVILLPAMIFILDELYKLCDNLHIKSRSMQKQKYALVYKTVLTIFVAKMFYFYQGNSNSLATIDLNPGYIGQSSYNPVIVAVFVTLNTFCAHINAFMYLILHIFDSQNGMQHGDETVSSKAELLDNAGPDLQLVVSLYTASTILPVAFYYCLLFAFRDHLFIYSVFSPKALYESFNIIVFYLNFCITFLYLKIFS